MSIDTALKNVLSGASLVLSVLAQEGVKLGHLGNEDFIELAEQLSTLVYGALAAKTATDSTATSTTSTGS